MVRLTYETIFHKIFVVRSQLHLNLNVLLTNHVNRAAHSDEIDELARQRFTEDEDFHEDLNNFARIPKIDIPDELDFDTRCIFVRNSSLHFNQLRPCT